jgi:hypothetical protein
MTDKPQRRITIWFFVGALFTVYGALILGCGIYGLFKPPDVVLPELHVDLWWGGFLFLFGLFFTIRFRPTKEMLSGEQDDQPESQ